MLDAVVLCILSFMEHRKNIRPSSIILVYLVFSIAFDAVQCRTLWLLQSDQRLHTIASIFSISVGIRVVIFVLEAKEKRSLLIPPWNRASPESLSGTISRSFFWWLNTLFSRGYRGVLNLDSLWPTEHSMSSDQLLARVSAVWDKTNDKKKKHALALALVESLNLPIMAMMLPRLCLIPLRFAQPLLLNTIVKFVSQSVGESRVSTGYGIIGATALTYGGGGVSATSSLISRI